jgi:aspartyl-tRNA(Asn)/glutamyl-tRNA(Gln) amidotransferase subunit A
MPAPAGSRTTVRQTFRALFNLLGFPALVLPAGFSSSPPGLPVGLQLAAKPFEEETIYRAAQAFEGATDWSARRPVL